MPWNEDGGAVTRTFDEWKITDKEIRSFLSTGMKFADQGFEGALRRAEEQFDPEGSDHPFEIAEKETGIDPCQYEQMLLAACLKDAVTAYEVYLEHALEEVLQRHGLSLPSMTASGSMRFGILKDAYRDFFGIEIEDDAIRDARELRHLLTHRRGHAFVKEDWERFSADAKNREFFRGRRIQLSREDIERRIHAVATKVREIDPVIWEYSWGGKTSEAMIRLGERSKFKPEAAK